MKWYASQLGNLSRLFSSMAIITLLASETQPIIAQERVLGSLARACKAGQGQIVDISVDRTGRFTLVSMAEPNQLCVYALQQDGHFECIARSNVLIDCACFSADGNTLLLGGFGLRTWNFRDSTGFAIDLDRNPDSRRSSIVRVNPRSGQIAASDWNVTYSSERGVYIASDITGSDGVWTELPGRDVQFTENGRHLVVLNKTHFAVYSPKGAEIGTPLAVFRELNPETFQISSEVSMLTQEGETTATRHVVRGQAYRFSTCTVGETHYLAFATNSPTDVDCSAEIWAFSESKGAPTPACAVISSSGNLCTVRLKGQLVPCLASNDAAGVNLLPVTCTDGKWHTGRRMRIDCSVLPAELFSEDSAISSFEISAGKDTVFVGYESGCIAEWRIPATLD